MVKPVQSLNLRLPFKIVGIAALCAFPFILPLLKPSCTARLFGPPLESPETGSDFAWEMNKLHSNYFMTWFSVINLKLEPKSLGQDFCDYNAQIIETLQDYKENGITDADREFVRNPINYNNELTIAIVSHDDYVINEEVADIARAEKNTFLAGAAAANPTFPIQWEDLRMLLERKRESSFLIGLDFNKKLGVAFEKYREEYNQWKTNGLNSATIEYYESLLKDD